MSVEIGEKAPDFTLPTDGNGSITLSALKGKKVVLYFYPKDDTSGCTAEACGFRDAFPDYGGAGSVVIGISKDSVASHDKFKKKHELPFILASDAGSDVCEKYGVWVEKSMYGRKYMGIERCTYLIDQEGVVRGVWTRSGCLATSPKCLKQRAPSDFSLSATPRSRAAAPRRPRTQSPARSRRPASRRGFCRPRR
jgi:peroxiredoxin Q/BCP